MKKVYLLIFYFLGFALSLHAMPRSEDVDERNKLLETYTTALNYCQEIETQINSFECDEYVPRILVIGRTGAGKSTLINHLLGSDLVAENKLNARGKPTGMYMLKADPEIAKVGHNTGSQTACPKCFKKEEEYKKVIIIDCPGFYDTSGEHADLINGICINKALNYQSNGKVSQKIGILFVSPQEYVTETRVTSLRQDLQSLLEWIPHEEDQRKLAIVISRFNSSSVGGLSPTDLFINNTNEVEEIASFSESLETEFGQGKKRIFGFLRPTTEGVLNPAIDDIEGLMKFISCEELSNGLEIVPTYNPRVNTLLGEIDGQLCKRIVKGKLQFFTNEVHRAFLERAGEVSKQSEELTAISNALKKWGNKLNEVNEEVDTYNSHAYMKFVVNAFGNDEENSRTTHLGKLVFEHFPAPNTIDNRIRQYFMETIKSLADSMPFVDLLNMANVAHYTGFDADEIKEMLKESSNKFIEQSHSIKTKTMIMEIEDLKAQNDRLASQIKEAEQSWDWDWWKGFIVNSLKLGITVVAAANEIFSSKQ